MIGGCASNMKRGECKMIQVNGTILYENVSQKAIYVSMFGKRRKNQRHAGGAKLKHDYKN